ncbi:HMA2 domain-containing protein [Nitrosococcus wardiae]|uniref:Heavy-metal-associated domain-containing protein n=1 Tax=Nitrosococcus wardiae TaxID=1814290 RepID=A0A4P7C2V3_9GAMM|nr:heavy-metal-associated domain-containing protein [Nitrosococcus wardiae]QBQ55186.1 heavy-metal-associated domain-containing protein [Nitrosococcus wardiae]
MAYYIHSLPGRLRVRSSFIKHYPTQAEALKRRIAALPGVQSVKISSITILYHAHELAADTLLEMFEEAGCLEGALPSRDHSAAAAKAGEVFGKAVFDVFIAKALERSLVSLLAVLKSR